MNGSYEELKRRLLADAAVLHILAQKPELKVTLDRQTIECDGKSLRGRIARMMTRKFFDEPRTGPDVIKELERSAFTVSVGGLYNELAELCRMGFLIKETKGDKKAAGYRSVEGMKVNIVEN